MTELQGTELITLVNTVIEQLETLIAITLGTPPAGQEILLYKTASISYLLFLGGIIGSILIFQWKWGGKR